MGFKLLLRLVIIICISTISIKASPLTEKMIVGITQIPLTKIEKNFLDAHKVAGVILTGKNWQYYSKSELKTFINELKSTYKAPNQVFWVSVDQEGGRVARLKNGFQKIPSAQQIGQTMTPNDAFYYGRLIGSELAEVGINMNFAPVIDIQGQKQNTVIGNRSYSKDPFEVARFGLAFSRGLMLEGITPVVKHYPGHGSTIKDSHVELPVVHKSIKDLQRSDFLPFKLAIHHKLPAMMSAHVVFSKVDSKNPASLSPFLLKKILRYRLKYKGLVISDDIAMKAITNTYSIQDACNMAIDAGNDLVLMIYPLDKFL